MCITSAICFLVDDEEASPGTKLYLSMYITIQTFESRALIGRTILPLTSVCDLGKGVGWGGGGSRPRPSDIHTLPPSTAYTRSRLCLLVNTKTVSIENKPNPLRFCSRSGASALHMTRGPRASNMPVTGWKRFYADVQLQSQVTFSQALPNQAVFVGVQSFGPSFWSVINAMIKSNTHIDPARQVGNLGRHNQNSPDMALCFSTRPNMRKRFSSKIRSCPMYCFSFCIPSKIL